MSTIQDRYSISDNPEEMLEEWLRENLYDLHTSSPCVVNAFNSENRTVDVNVAIKRDFRGIPENLTILRGVPVVYPSGANFDITWPIEIGDTGLITFCESSIDRWLTSEGLKIVNPLDTRMHDYSDGVFIAGLQTYSNASPVDEDSACFRYNDSKIKMSKNGNIEISNDSGSITLDENGKLCVNASGVDLLSVMINAIEKADTTGAAMLDIQSLRTAVC